MPNIQVKLRRGTTAQHANFTGAEGEVTVDTDKETLVVHDNATAGGHELRRKDDTIAGSEIDDNAVTSAKISDSDNTFKVAATEVVVNEGGADIDFRVEGDNNANLINANGQNDIVGIGMEPDAANVFGSTTFKAQVKDGAFIENDTGIAKLKLLTNKTGGGTASITLQSTTPPSTNEGHYSIFIGGAEGRLNFTNETTSNGMVLDNTGTLTIDGILNLLNLGTYADDTAAGVGGLGAGDVYKTATGELRIKL